jgi:hypothetical protein
LISLLPNHGINFLNILDYHNITASLALSTSSSLHILSCLPTTTTTTMPQIAGKEVGPLGYGLMGESPPPRSFSIIST